MPDPRDLLTTWQEAIRQLRSGAQAIGGPPAELVRPLLAPLERQAEMLEEVLRRQVDFEGRLTGQMLGPYRVALEALEQTSAAMRAQAELFDTAATSFEQASKLMAKQADLMDRAAQSLRDPVQLLKSGAQPARLDDRGSRP